jgi:transposase InsO family protein
MTFQFIDAQRQQFPVERLCAALDVSDSGYYAWRQRPISAREQTNQELLMHIRTIHAQSRRTYGSPRVHAELRAQGYGYNRKRVARLMHEHGLRAKMSKRYRVTTMSNHGLPVAPNHLGREFWAERPNEKWVSDITYIPTTEGWLYLSAVMDLYSRAIVGWSMSGSLSSTLAQDALQMAIARRQPDAGLLHHSDRGVQYASADYQTLLSDQQMIPSMSGRGNCYDNAAMESFFGTLKSEQVNDQHYHTRTEARQDIFSYIEVFYNRQRRHSTLGYLSPAEFERQSMS